jgi:hypothetical protein
MNFPRQCGRKHTRFDALTGGEDGRVFEQQYCVRLAARSNCGVEIPLALPRLFVLDSSGMNYP